MHARKIDPSAMWPMRQRRTLLFNHLLGGGVLMYILLCMPLHPAAQHLLTPNVLTVDDGLSSRDIRAIAQDGHGLMWFGTSNGLNRYDGYRILTFDHQENHDFTPRELLQEGLLPGNDSTLWVVGDNQLYHLDLRTLDARPIGDIDGQVWQIRKGHSGELWVISDNRHMQYLWRSADNELFEKLDSIPRLRREFTDLKIDSDGHVWWSTNLKGLRQYDHQGELLREVRVDSFDWYGTKMFFTPLFIDSRNRIFLFPKSKHQLWQYFPDDHRIEVLLDSLETPVYYAIEGSNGSIWFATKKTVYQLYADGNWTVDLRTPTPALDFTEITAIYEDRTNMLWIGTDGGLLRMPVRKQLFDHMLARPEGGWGNSMRAMAEDQNGRIYSLVISGDPGLFMYDPKTGETVKMQFRSAEWSRMLNWANNMIYLPSQHAIWTYNGVLSKISITDHTIRQFDISLENSSSGFNPINMLPDGRLIFGNTPSGVIICDPETEVISALPITGTQKDPDDIRITCFRSRPDGSFWLGTMEDGLYLVGYNGAVQGHWSTRSKPAIGGDHVLCLFFDDDPDDLWIGTFGGGLDHLDVRDGVVQNFNKNEGLPDDKVVGILADGDNLWLGTYNGLSCFNRVTQTFQNYFEEDGLSHHEFNYSSAFKDSRGRFYFGGMNGVNIFRPEDVLEREENPPLHLTSFIEFDHREGHVIERALERSAGPVIISPYVSYFQVEWTLPNYFHPDKNQYWTWLEGLEEDWGFLGNVPRIRFNSLAPGDYILHIKGTDSRGNPAATELAIPLHVQRIFYQRWWFIGLSVLVIGGIAFGIVRYRYRQKLAMERVRTRIAGDLHDEVGSMLTGLAMQAELLEMQDAPAGKSTLAYIKDVSRNAVSKMRDMTWSIDSGRDRVEDLLDRMHEYASETLTPADIVYSINTTGLKPSLKMPVEHRRHLFLIFKEAITNICKHANATQVEIFLGNVDGGFEMRIHDNGSSFSANGKYTGLGLASMRRRAEAMGGTCEVVEEKGCLVRVRLGKGI